MEIKIIRSRRRRRTISARMEGGVMLVSAPRHTPEAELNTVIAKFRKRFERRSLRKELNLKQNLNAVCRRFNEEYFDNRIDIRSIEYSTEQTTKWGVCNHRNKTILISHRLAAMPAWVRDYVIIHEMAHILHPNHGERFWQLVNRYRLAERARGYLIAKGYEDIDKEDEGTDNKSATDFTDGREGKGI
ncbi:MAG: M48 family metallopeptidase [Planctomycetes bacterium]|nr:M48 family metallopeptidase [Planctomycetota bacterium]